MLKKYLSEKKNSHARESIFMSRLSYDLKLAAAQRDYYLKTYFEDVDHDGFDIILDDDDSIIKLQVKTVMSGGQTNSWNIHKCILRPQLHLIETVGFEPSPEGEGVGGGFILMELECMDNDVNVTYHYVDLLILLAFYLNVLPYSEKKTLDEKFVDLKKGSSHETIAIPKGLMWKAKSPTALLSLMGIHSAEAQSWRHDMLVLANNEMQFASRDLELPAPVDKFKVSIKEKLDSLSTA